MAHLTSAQLHRLNRVVLALYEDVFEPSPIEPIIELIETLLPVSWISVDVASFNDKSVSHISGRRLELLPNVDERVAKYCHENPVIAFAQSGGFEPALKISDFANFRVIQRTGFYQEVAKFFPGWRDQAAVAIRLPGRSLGFGLNRDRRFTPEELLMLRLLQPHVERVLQRSIQHLELGCNSRLTPREREILQWVAEGKRDSEIAQILQLSVRTVEQHVAVCLRKLEVETRGAAAAEVWRARRSAEHVQNSPSL